MCIRVTVVPRDEGVVHEYRFPAESTRLKTEQSQVVVSCPPAEQVGHNPSFLVIGTEHSIVEVRQPPPQEAED